MSDQATHVLPRITEPALARSVLTLPVAALPGVNDACQVALELIGITTVYDLARSLSFAAAHQLAGTGDDVRSDWVKAKHPNDDPPGVWPIDTLRNITPTAGTKLQKALGVKNVGEFGAWPPYHLACDLHSLAIGLGAATDDSAKAAGFDESVPADLVPGNSLPTESVRYTTLVLGEVQKPPGAHAANSILKATQLDLTVALEKANSGFQQVAEGALLTYEQSWFNQGVALGDVRKTIPLAAGEVVRVAQRDWTHRQGGQRTEAGVEGEQLSNVTGHNRALSEVASAVAAEAQSGFTSTDATSSSWHAGSASSGGLVGAVLGGTTTTTGVATNITKAMTATSSQGSRNVNSSMQQNVNEATQQQASASRSRRATVVEEISEADAATASTRILANYNHGHALNVVFYELVQVCRVQTTLRKVQKVLFVPLKMVDFSKDELTPDGAAALLPYAMNPDIFEMLR